MAAFDRNPEHEPVRIGCAGWSLSSAVAAHFPDEGSHLERYAQVLNAVEINTSFYRPHRPETYARWRDSVPEDFRFSAKLPKSITHQARLLEAEPLLSRFVSEVSELGHKLGCLLLQLPPSLRYDDQIAGEFFDLLRRHVTVPVVCEPRHVSWTGAEAAARLAQAHIDYVQADPVVVDAAAFVERSHVVYVRLHGSPDIYRSTYSENYLDKLAARLLQLKQEGKAVWCIFDNTAEGAAVPNALGLQARLSQAAPPV